MHNNIMAAGSKDRPPMLGPGRYSQWRSRFLRYIDTKNNGEGLKKCILNGPYVPTSVLIQAVPAAEGRPAVQQHTAIETVLNMTLENKEHFQSEKEAIFLLCKLFTSRDGESMESYYSRFYKLMNELTRNNLQVTLMQVNVQFLQQLQPEWSSTFQKAVVNVDIRAERIAKCSWNKLKRDKKCKEFGTPCKVFQEALQNLPTTTFEPSSNSRNRLKIPHQGYNNDQYCQGSLANQRNKNVAGARETEQSEDTDEEIDETGIESHLSATWQYSGGLPKESSSNWSAIWNSGFKYAPEWCNERVALTNLIANLTLDTECKQKILKAIKESKRIIGLQE
ncbi:hypothetical protein Tco_0552183 [Tanacetum coccineum]